MRSLGTITMYYHFVNQETRDTIESIIDNSQTYHEFTINLGTRVCESEASSHLVYLAVVHSWQLAELEMMQNIATKYHENVIIRPWIISQSVPDKTEGLLAQIRKSVEDVIAAKPEDWILAQLPQVFEGFPTSLFEYSEFFEDVGNLLASQSDLECFKPAFYNLKGWRYALDDDVKNAISEINLGLHIAKKYDDRFRIMRILIDLANLTKNSDTKLAESHLESAQVLCKELDSKHDKDVILNEMGLLSTIRGEFDLALFCHRDSVHLKQGEGNSEYFKALNLSHAYRNIDDHLEALQWAETALELAEPKSSIWAHLALGRSLTDLRLLEKAAYHIDMAKSLSLRSGHESILGEYYYVLGLYEIAMGDPTTAIQTLEQALDIYKRQGILLYIIYCLMALTKAELAIIKTKGSKIDSDSSGPWMSELRKVAVDNDLPGIMMQHGLMKSELQLLQGRTEAAKETLESALSISDSIGVRTLRTKILSKIQSLDEEP